MRSTSRNNNPASAAAASASASAARTTTPTGGGGRRSTSQSLTSNNNRQQQKGHLHEHGISSARAEQAAHNRRLVLSRTLDKIVDRSIREGQDLDYDGLRQNFEDTLAERHRYHEAVESAKKEEYRREALRKSRFMATTTTTTTNKTPSSSKNNQQQEQKQEIYKEEGGSGMGTIHQLFSVSPTFVDEEGNVAPEGFGQYTNVISTQGGATLWASVDTDAEDGITSTIQLIDGFDGRELHRVETRENCGACTCLFSLNPSNNQVEVERAGASFVWAGFADGTVQVFDALIATPVTEGRFHEGAVLAFCSSHGGRVFSAGADGTLVRWNTENSCFEAMSKIMSGHSGMITSLTSCRGGKTLFSSSEDGTLREYNVIDGRLRSVRVPPQFINNQQEQQQQHVDPTSSLMPLGGDPNYRPPPVFSPLRAVVTSGPVIVSGGDTGELHVWASLPPLSADGTSSSSSSSGNNNGGTEEPGVDNHPLSVVPSPPSNQGMSSSHVDGQHSGDYSSPVAVWSMFVDPILDHVWVGRADGIAYCYRRQHTALSLINVVVIGNSHMIIKNLHAFCCVDSTTTWTVGADGMNFLWNSSRDRSTTQAETAVNTMSTIVDKDERELVKWREALQKLNESRRNRAQRLAAVMEMNYQRGVRMIVMNTWKRFKLHKIEIRMRLQFAEYMNDVNEKDLIYPYFVRWFWWSRLAVRVRLKNAFCKILSEDAKRRPRALPLFVAKLQSFVCRLREAELRRNLLTVLRNSGRYASALRAFRLWSAWSEKRREWLKRDALRLALGRTLKDFLLRRYYQKWIGWMQRNTDHKNKLMCMQAFLNNTARGARRYWYLRWQEMILKRRQYAQKRSLVQALSMDMDQARMLHAFVKWKRWRLLKKKEQLEARSGILDAKKSQMSPQYLELQELLKQKRTNDDMENEVLKKRERIMNLKTQLAYGDRVTRDLEMSLELARAQAADRQATMADKLSNIVARMKAKLLNFSSDLPQIQTIADKSRSLESRKIFLESHATVKRIVVDVIKDPHHPVDKPWPLTHQLLQKIPSHSVSQLNQAIKTMIVTFDLMPKEQRLNLTSDYEIILNGEWLIAMAEKASKAFIQGGGKK